MGKKWDHNVPSVEFWKEVYRVLKPGGHVLSFGGTRTYHRMTVNIEDAGFEIRDQIMWLYGSGFPKSHNIGKSIDKIQGNEREVVGEIKQPRMNNDFGKGNHNEREVKDLDITKGTSEWEGWGTALKPANEPICLARKPLSEKTVALNVLKWGTGGINIDGCRVEGAYGSGQNEIVEGKESGVMYHNYDGDTKPATGHKQRIQVSNSEGRFPANIILDEDAGKVLGEPSRFFYCAKVSKKERNVGCDELEEKLQAGAEFRPNHMEKALNGEDGNPYGRYTPTKNNHPTVKPIDLMAYLCRLITPPNGIVLDPFMGSGSTGCAAVKEGFKFCGMEMEEEYFEIATKRIEYYKT
jgi:site-specific DNA-methyltransferase (adenine-specific)